MIDHFTLTVRDIARTKEFYTKALAPLGYSLKRDFGTVCAFGDERKPYFWLKEGNPTAPMHIAFRAPNRSAVHAFHEAAIEAGARDDGSPGLRPQYHPNYYGSFVVDPDGHPIEACYHLPPDAPKAKPPAKAKAKAKPKPKPKPKKKAKAKR